MRKSREVSVAIEDINLLVSAFQALLNGNARVFEAWLDEANRGAGETEFQETVLTRLRELQGLTAGMKGPQKPVKQRVLELLAFVEAWK